MEWAHQMACRAYTHWEIWRWKATREVGGQSPHRNYHVPWIFFGNSVTNLSRVPFVVIFSLNYIARDSTMTMKVIYSKESFFHL